MVDSTIIRHILECITVRGDDDGERFYETGNLLTNGKKAKPIGRMRDPDATIGVVLDSAAWRHLFGESVKFGGTPGPRRRPSKINA